MWCLMHGRFHRCVLPLRFVRVVRKERHLNDRLLSELLFFGITGMPSHFSAIEDKAQ